MVQAKNLRDDLVACGACSRCTHSDGGALQLGIGFGNDFVQPTGFHHSEALQTQGRQKLVVGDGGCDCTLGGQRHQAPHARIDDDISAGDGGHGTGHSFDFSVDKIQRDGLAFARRTDQRLRLSLARWLRLLKLGWRLKLRRHCGRNRLHRQTRRRSGQCLHRVDRDDLLSHGGGCQQNHAARNCP